MISAEGFTVFEPIALNSIERYVQTDLGNDFLVTLTDRQYSSPDAFIAESHSFGYVAKRIPYIPRGFRLGISRVFVSFFWTKDENKGMPSTIFAYFIGDGVDLIVPADREQINRYREFASVPGIVLIPENVAVMEPERSIGRREAGQVYMTSRAASKKLQLDVADREDLFSSVEAGLAVFKKPYQYQGEYFRTIKHFDPKDFNIPLGIVAPPTTDTILKLARTRMLPEEACA